MNPGRHLKQKSFETIWFGFCAQIKNTIIVEIYSLFGLEPSNQKERISVVMNPECLIKQIPHKTKDNINSGWESCKRKRFLTVRLTERCMILIRTTVPDSYFTCTDTNFELCANLCLLFQKYKRKCIYVCATRRLIVKWKIHLTMPSFINGFTC